MGTKNAVIVMDYKEMEVLQKAAKKALHDLQAKGIDTNREEVVIFYAQSFLKAAVDEMVENAKAGESVELPLLNENGGVDRFTYKYFSIFKNDPEVKFEVTDVD